MHPETGTLASRILRAILLVVLAVVVLCAALMAWVLYDTVNIREQHELRNELLLIEEGLPQAKDRAAYLSSLGTNDIRVTWIAQDGTVLYDSLYADSSALDNHRNRPEIAEALAKGEGQSSRFSDTLDEVAYYHALRLDDGTVLRLSSTRDSVLSVLSDLVMPGALAVIALVIAVVFIARGIARRTMIPLNEIDLDAPSQNEMYEELEPLLTRISEQRKQLDAHMKEAEENRRALVANVSHELKTPLTVISGYAELLKDGIVNPEDIQQVSTLIHEEAGYMRTLVDDLLTLAKLDEYTSTGNTTDHAVPVDLASLSADILARLAPFAEQNEVITKLTCSGDVKVLGIEKILTSVIYNLCENGIRYNRHGGLLTIDIAGLDDEVCLTVSDTGIGIALEDQPHVFERFYRVDQTHSRETGGTGLGLAIVKHGALYHRATITLESVLGQGTTVKVVFPRA